MNPTSILIGTGIFLGVSAGLDKFVFKKEFDAKQTLINASIVAFALGIAVVVSKKVGVSGKPLPTEVLDQVSKR